jgi:hypothetical protein
LECPNPIRENIPPFFNTGGFYATRHRRAGPHSFGNMHEFPLPRNPVK